MNIWHAVFRPESLTYTVAKALSYGGHNVFIWVRDPGYDEAEAGGISRRVTEIPNVRIVPSVPSRLPPDIDRLIVQVHPRPAELLNDIGAIARRAHKVALITSGDRSRSRAESVLQQWFELRRLGGNARKIDRVLYKDGFYRHDLFSVLRQRSVVGFDAHSQFLHETVLFEAMHARDWEPEARRPILVNFLGSRDPSARAHVLDQVRSFFSSCSGRDPKAETAEAMYWHEYSDAAPTGVDPLEFVNILTRSDFTLCPRGYSIVTHRPIEALLRGSIPVLSAEDLDLYGIDLRVGENCIAVVGDGWPEAMRALVRMDVDKKVAMRRNIRAQFETQLCYRALSAGIRIRLGA